MSRTGYAGLLVLVLGGAGWLVLHRDRAATPAAPPGALDTAKVVRADVAEHQVVSGTLGYPGSVNVVASAGGGTITWLPRTGATIAPDQRLYEVDGRPVLLWSGARPAWRDFMLGMTPGPDVTQLERNLATLGYGRKLTVDSRFSAATAAAIRRWQAAHRLPHTGSIRLGDVVFLPRPVRVGSVPAALGSPVQPGLPVLTVTSTVKAVTANLDPTQQDLVHVGDRVSISLISGTRTASGTVTAAGARVTISLAGREDGTGPVQVSITTAEHRNVLAVPVDALLAAPGGGYQVATLDHGRRLVSVRTGLFDESGGVVEVTGAGITEGTTVEVPAL